MQDVEFTCESGYAVNVGNVIATGTAGTVYNGRSSDGTPVVVKVVKDGKSASTCRELEVLRACCKGDSRSANLHPRTTVERITRMAAARLCWGWLETMTSRSCWGLGCVF